MSHLYGKEKLKAKIKICIYEAEEIIYGKNNNKNPKLFRDI